MFPDLFNGYKTYFAAAGLMGLALYQFSQGDVPAAIQTFCAGLAALGLRHAIAKNNSEDPPVPRTPVGPRLALAGALLAMLLLADACRAQEVSKTVLDRIRAVSVSIEIDGEVVGSGTLFDKGGETWCLTAQHVVKRATSKLVRVTQCRKDKRLSVYAEIFKEDEQRDAALLKVGTGVFGAGVKFGTCRPKLDAPLVHCGSMSGHHHTVTRGYLVGHDQDFKPGQRRDLGDFTGYYGSSGGGVFTADGQYAGMVVGGLGMRLVYFVPIDSVEEVLR